MDWFKNLGKFYKHLKSFDSSNLSYNELLRRKGDFELRDKEFRTMRQELEQIYPSESLEEMTVSMTPLPRERRKISEDCLKCKEQQIGPYKRKVEQYSNVILSAFVGGIVETMDAKGIAFVYHNVSLYHSQGSLELDYTLKVPKILGIKDDERLSLRSILGLVGESKILDNSRMELTNPHIGYFTYLKEKLKKNSKGLQTRVVSFRNKDVCIGEGLFLYEGKMSGRQMRHHINFLKHINWLFKEFKERISLIKPNGPSSR